MLSHKRSPFIILLLLLSSVVMSNVCSEGEKKEQGEFSYTAASKRNPFIPLVTNDGRLLKIEENDETKKEELILEGIIYDPQGISYAIINGQVLKVADPVGDYMLLRIEENRVILIKENQERVINLKEEGQ